MLCYCWARQWRSIKVTLGKGSCQLSLLDRRAAWKDGDRGFLPRSGLQILKVIYHPLYGMNNNVLIWGDWLSCDSPHDSQSPHIWGDWLSCDPLRGSHDSQSPHIRKHLYPILWQL